MHVLWHKLVGVLSREKDPLQQLHSKKGSGFIFAGGPISGDEVPCLHVYYIQVVYVMQETMKNTHDKLRQTPFAVIA